MTHYLPNGHTIKDPKLSCEYTIKGVLGRGASTIAYLADYSDESGLVSERILKEYHPSTLSVSRDDNGALICVENQLDKYQDGLNRFKTGGETQNDLRKCTGLVNETPPLQRIFEANNTCYFDVVPFAGRTFDKIETFSVLERLKICLAAAKVLKQYHSHGKLYLDLKPENLFVLTNAAGEIVTDLVVLIDFDSVIDKDKIAFGNSLSFTKSWAAPEQINPHAFRKIAEATDVYALGELVFWCVFGRHSTAEEHRGFSTYSFDDTIRYSVQRQLTELFLNTLRSSPSNRFASMNDVVDLLETVVDELSKKEFIITHDITPKRFFLGREAELDEIGQALQTEKVVFVTGMAGIGKSELVKRHVKNNRDQYDNVLYWTYDGSLMSMVCDDNAVSIATFVRYPDEPDEVYAGRKLSKLAEFLSPKSLIVIDNVDVLVGEYDSSALWNQIKALPAKILISSRIKEKEYKCVEVKEISETSILRKLFLEYCPSALGEDSQIEYIDRIIEVAGRHTYEIELLGAYTEEKMQLPQKTVEEMEQAGFSSLGGTRVSVQKDGDDTEASFVAHLKKLLSMSKLSKSQHQLLVKLSFMPAVGINTSDFKEFYGITDLTDLSWLIKHGFAADAGNAAHTLTVHPAVSEAVISIAKADNNYMARFYKDAFIAMRRGYDSQSVNEDIYRIMCEHLESPHFAEAQKKETGGEISEAEMAEAIEKARAKLAAEYAKSDISQGAYCLMCEFIAQKTVLRKVDCIEAAKYITQYVEWFVKYGQLSLQVMMEYALRLFDSYSQGHYMPDREYAYWVYAELKMRCSFDYAAVTTLCTEHMRSARRAKDWLMAYCWSQSIEKAHVFMDDTVMVPYQNISLPQKRSLREAKEMLHDSKATCGDSATAMHNTLWVFCDSVRSLYFALRHACQRKTVREKFGNSFTLNTAQNSIQSAEVFESKSKLYAPSTPKYAIETLKHAIEFRRRATGICSDEYQTDNETMIAIDRACIWNLQMNYAEAKSVLVAVLAAYSNGQCRLTVAAQCAAELLGDVCVILGEYGPAIEAYCETLRIAEIMGGNNIYSAKVKLGRAYNLAGDTERAKEHNFRIWEEMKNISFVGLRPIVADSYYNVGDFYFLVGELEKSERFIDDALAIYEESTHYRLHNNIGRARCYERLARINQMRGLPEVAAKKSRRAVDLIEEMLGSKHPEVIAFKRMRDTLQT